MSPFLQHIISNVLYNKLVNPKIQVKNYNPKPHTNKFRLIELLLLQKSYGYLGYALWLKEEGIGRIWEITFWLGFFLSS